MQIKNRTAIFWIRDGVLIDRMAVNAVAFAFACLHHKNVDNSHLSMSDLINFAFETSGISCTEKIVLLNAGSTPVVSNVEATVVFYNQLTADAGSRCMYFSGAKQLLEKTQELGCLNFITSAVHQDLLDDWWASQQALILLPYLDEVLGWRSAEICKGRGHFNYVREKFGTEKIIYVADAVSEIADGHKNSHEFKVVPIGYANRIKPEAVAQAFDMVLDAFLKIADFPEGDLSNFNLEFSKLALPDQNALEKALVEAGAVHVVGGSTEDIMGNLSLLLVNRII